MLGMDSERLPDPTFPEWLRDVMRESGKRREEVALRTGYSGGTVDAWRRGTRQPSERAADALADLFEVARAYVRQVADLDPPVDLGDGGTQSAVPDARDGESLLRSVREAQQSVDQLITGVRRFMREAGSAYEVEAVEMVSGPRVVQIPPRGRIPANVARWISDEDDGMPPIEVPASQLPGIRDPFALHVSGNCLKALDISDGDRLICYRDESRAPRNGDLVIVRVGDEATCKLWRSDEHGVRLEDGAGNIIHRFRDGDDAAILAWVVKIDKPTMLP